MGANIEQGVLCLRYRILVLSLRQYESQGKCGSKIVRLPGINCFYYSSVLGNPYKLVGAPRRAVCCARTCGGVSRFMNIVHSAPISRDHNHVSVSKGPSRGK